MRHALVWRKAFLGGTAAYAAVQAGAYALENISTTGIESDVALALSLLAGFVAVGAALLLSSDSDRATNGRLSPVWFAWRVSLWLLIVIRIVLAYRINRAIGGIAGAKSYGWIVISAGLAAGSVAAFRRGSQSSPGCAPVGDRSVLGKYEVRGLLGRGAMGEVHDAWDPVIARRVAIKTIPLGAAEADSEMLARFRREAQAAGRLLHPNIVSVFDYGETERCAYIVMEFVDGPSLATVLERRRHIPAGEVLRIMNDMLAGLQYSHEHGIVHRDIKPANIMLTREGQAKIADFGIARLDGASVVTEAGKVLGTAAYMSPEQFLGESVDARTDIYSAGVLLYRLLTGERPFEGSMTTIMHQVMNTDAMPPSARRASVPATFDRVVARAMAKRPTDRYPSAAALAHAIRAAAAASTEALEPTVLGAADTKYL